MIIYICVQLPKCELKQGLVTTKKGKYCDLMYNFRESDKLITWIETLEQTIQDRIDEKNQLWFQSDLTRDDIEAMMSPISRTYKSGKKILIRSYIDTSKQTGKITCSIYDENEVLLELNNLENNFELIPLLKIEGVRFTSRSFELDIKIYQMMILEKQSEKKMSCLIKHTTYSKKQPVQESLDINEFRF